MNPETKLLRSWMFVPGNRQRMVEKALALTNVDAVMFDIEDGVAPAEKEAARQQIAASLVQLHERKQADPAIRTPARYVRINAIGHDRMYADLADIVQAELEGLVLPKVETPDQVKVVEHLLDRHEHGAKIPRGHIRLLVAIESPRGLLDAFRIATASPRVIGLIFGAEDFGRELGLPLRREGEARDLLHARSTLVTVAAAAHVQAVDGVWPDLEDTGGLQQFAVQSRRLGFTGMSLIHPSQIDAVNAVFTPTADEIAYCREVVQAFEDAQARGEGAIAFRGQLIDPPIVERARRTLALAGSLGL